MVFFTCDGCGESLKKNQVEKHRFKCRRSHALSCMDCNQIFRDEEFKSHTKCITEEQKYAAKGYVAKQNKGEMKQQAWVENVRLAIQNSNPENKRLQEVLKRLEEYPNIPRKQAKFVNFLGNSINVRDKKLASDVWIAISTAAKTIEERKLAENAKNTPKATENGEKSSKKVNDTPAGKGQKRKIQDDTKESPEDNSAKKPRKVSEPEEAIEDGTEENAGIFKWKNVIKKFLKKSPAKSMKMKKLQKQVLGEYEHRAKAGGEQAVVEEPRNIFMKKLASMKKVIVEGKNVKYEG